MACSNGVRLMILIGIRGSGINTQGRAIRRSLEMRGCVVQQINVGSYHTRAEMRAVCTRDGQTKGLSARSCAACPDALDLDRSYTSVNDEIEHITSSAAFVLGDKRGVLILQGRSALSVEFQRPGGTS